MCFDVYPSRIDHFNPSLSSSSTILDGSILCSVEYFTPSCNPIAMQTIFLSFLSFTNYNASLPPGVPRRSRSSIRACRAYETISIISRFDKSGVLTRTRGIVIAVAIARYASVAALLIVMSIVFSLQAQNDRQCAEDASHTEEANAALLLWLRSTGSGSHAEPTSLRWRAMRAVVRVVGLNVRLFGSPLLTATE